MKCTFGASRQLSYKLTHGQSNCGHCIWDDLWTSHLVEMLQKKLAANGGFKCEFEKFVVSELTVALGLFSPQLG